MSDEIYSRGYSYLKAKSNTRSTLDRLTKTTLCHVCGEVLEWTTRSEEYGDHITEDFVQVVSKCCGYIFIGTSGDINMPGIDPDLLNLIIVHSSCLSRKL